MSATAFNTRRVGRTDLELTELGLGGATHFNYLVGGTDTIDGFLLLKLGVGWEKN